MIESYAKEKNGHRRRKRGFATTKGKKDQGADVWY